MWLIAGLGNPGAKYHWNRHNIGFLAIESFAKSLGVPPPDKKQHQALMSKFKLDGQDILLAMPQTFMNLSGQSLQKFISYYNIELDRLVVIQDDIESPFGSVKLQKKRGHGGHNGIRDIHAQLGSNDYLRIKIGVGRPSNDKITVADYVLKDFSKTEINELQEVLDRCGDCLEQLIDQGFEKTSANFK